MPITDSSHVIRNAAHASYVEALNAQYNADVARHQAAINACSEQHQHEIAEAARMIEDTTIALEASLATAVQSTMRPLFARFVRTPTRELAREVREYYRKLNDRSIFELGEGLSPQHVGIALGAAYGLHERMADPFYFRYTGLNAAPYKIGAMVDAFLSNKSDVVCEGAIIEAERAISGRGALDPANPERLAVLLSKASKSAVASTLGAYDVPEAPGYGSSVDEHCQTRVLDDKDPTGMVAIAKWRQAHPQSLGR